MASISVDLDLEQLTWDLYNDLDSEELLDFVLAIDDRVCDFDFTQNLYDRLKEILDRKGA